MELQLTLALDQPGGVFELLVEDDATVEHVLKRLGLEYDQVGLIVRNGLSLEAGDVLRDGDILMVFPPLSGG
ncbi:MAG: hypothetical protein HPY55_06015 [Firmicutes bacterium]|nr:hypothetical protein [Bacillota bacterium]